ncbi:MAG TPA: preprotein translocase subunit YajC [Bryobacterales bacterium]|nr:preprotein translocase subunit YajC [Bryobacterales bacterium]
MTLLPAILILLQAPSPGLGQFLPFILIFVIFYFVLFMPMQRRQKKQKQMWEGLKNGDQVLTSGGIVGTIVGLNEDNTVVLRIKPDNVKLQVARSAVSNLVGEEKK